jgi:hypothetical protein
MARSDSNTTTKVGPARCALQNGIDNVLTDCIDCAEASAYVVELEGKNSLVSVGMCSPCRSFRLEPPNSVFRYHRWGSFARHEAIGRALAQDGEDAQPLRDLGAIDVWESGTDGLVGEKKKACDPAARIII